MHLEGAGWYLDLLDGTMSKKEAIVFEKCKQKIDTTKCQFTHDTYFDK
jgi:hypothetical protein